MVGQRQMEKLLGEERQIDICKSIGSKKYKI